jgi:16S rRNA (guanine966-N2)-methyltransferase
VNQVRIIGGRWRRRVLRFPDALGLRPTPDRVRETVFNWLGQELDGLTCLDLFAGSGALGIEALSRGAVEVTLVEKEAAVVRALREQAAAIGLAGLRLEQSDALQFASRCLAQGRRFDLVFVDPPYRQGWWPKLSPLIDGLLAEGARAYVEAEARIDPPQGWRVFREGKAGQVFFHLFERDRDRVEDQENAE